MQDLKNKLINQSDTIIDYLKKGYNIELSYQNSKDVLHVKKIRVSKI